MSLVFLPLLPARWVGPCLVGAGKCVKMRKDAEKEREAHVLAASEKLEASAPDELLPQVDAIFGYSGKGWKEQSQNEVGAAEALVEANEGSF